MRRQPVVEAVFSGDEAFQQLSRVEIDGLRLVTEIGAREQLPNLADIAVAALREAQLLALRNDQVGTGAPDLGQLLTQVVAGTALSRLRPQQRRQPLPSLDLARFESEIGEQGLRLFPGEMQFVAVGGCGLEPAEQLQS